MGGKRDRAQQAQQALACDVCGGAATVHDDGDQTGGAGAWCTDHAPIRELVERYEIRRKSPKR